LTCEGNRNPVDVVSVLLQGFKDPYLSEAVIKAIQKPREQISISDFQNLEILYACNRNIADLSGLEICKNLKWLNLSMNRIKRIEPIGKLKNMDFPVNNISDLYALVENPGIDKYDVLDVTGNPLNDQTINEQIPALQRRGVTVIYK
jgi:hypothetical protein